MLADKELGQLGEAEAERFLKRQGFKILQKNFKIKDWGEIDVIAQDKDTLVFVEVKTLKSEEFQEPFELVTPQKMARLKLAGQIYQDEQSEELEPMRIDVVSVLALPNNQFKIEHFQGVEQMQ